MFGMCVKVSFEDMKIEDNDVDNEFRAKFR